LDEESLDKAKITTCDAGHRSDGLAIGEVGLIEMKAQLFPVVAGVWGATEQKPDIRMPERAWTTKATSKKADAFRLFF